MHENTDLQAVFVPSVHSELSAFVTAKTAFAACQRGFGPSCEQKDDGTKPIYAIARNDLADAGRSSSLPRQTRPKPRFLQGQEKYHFNQKARVPCAPWRLELSSGVLRENRSAYAGASYGKNRTW